MRPNRNIIRFLICIFRDNYNGRVLGFVFCFNNHLLLVTGLLIRFIPVCNTLLNGFKINLTIHLRKDYRVIWIPKTELVTFFHFCAILNIDKCAIGNMIWDQLLSGLLFHNLYFTCTTHYNFSFLTFRIGSWNKPDFFKLNNSIKLGCNTCFNCNIRSCTTHVEGT